MWEFLRALLIYVVNAVNNWMLWWRAEIYAFMRSVGDFVYALLPSEFAQMLGARPWSTVEHLFDWITPFVPVYEIIAIFITTFAIAGTIRLLRWVAAFVPGFNLGG